jgi:hypothetical protein
VRAAPSRPCPRAHTAARSGCKKAVQLEVVNTTGTAVSIQWIDYQGKVGLPA